jgi:hypothetical protein
MAEYDTDDDSVCGDDTQARIDSEAWLQQRIAEGLPAFKCLDLDSLQPVKDKGKDATIIYSQQNDGNNLIRKYISGSNGIARCQVNRRRYDVNLFTMTYKRRKDPRHSAVYLLIPVDEDLDQKRASSLLERIAIFRRIESSSETMQSQLLTRGTFLQLVRERPPRSQSTPPVVQFAKEEKEEVIESLTSDEVMDCNRGPPEKPIVAATNAATASGKQWADESERWADMSDDE